MEKGQIWIYVCALVIGAIFGLLNPSVGRSLDMVISPVLGILLYGMFAQIPFLQLKEAVKNRRFIASILCVNFICVPIVVWGLVTLFPQPPFVLIGVLLVLLTPCIDYVIVFTELGKGNAKLMLAATPILFVVQMLLLPLYLWLFVGKDMLTIVSVGPFIEAFVVLIVIPLIIAMGTQWYAMRSKRGKMILEGTAWIPVPFMAIVLIVVVASQIDKVYRDISVIGGVIPLYGLFLLIMPLIAALVAKRFKLDIGAGRALIFSSFTRNSLVVLPLALSLPSEVATVTSTVIVTQTMVELVGELIYIKLVPKLILRES